MRRSLFDADHEAFRESFRAFLDKEVVPHLDEWDAAYLGANRERLLALKRRCDPAGVLGSG